MTSANPTATPVPRPPVRSAAERGLDLLVWGGIVVLLIVAFRPVEMNKFGLIFYRRENPEAAAKVQVIWTSPELPESSIVVRKDLDPAVKEKIRGFFLSYGHAPGAEGDHQRQVLKGLAYTGFLAADNSYLDPVRQMEAADALGQAKHTGDAAKIAEAQKAFDALQAEVAGRTAANAPVTAAPPAAKKAP